MAKKYTATLVDGSSYSIVTKNFENGIPVEVTAQEKAVLEREVRTFKDPQTERLHTVKRFQFGDVLEEEIVVPARPVQDGTTNTGGDFVAPGTPTLAEAPTEPAATPLVGRVTTPLKAPQDPNANTPTEAVIPPHVERQR